MAASPLPLDVRPESGWTIIRSSRSGEALWLHAALVVNGARIHLHAFRVVGDAGEQTAELVEDAIDPDAICRLNPNESFQPVRLDGLPGDWLIYATPSKD